MNVHVLQLDIVKKVLELEDNSGTLNKQNGHGATALHTALQLQHLDVFDRLLEAGADPTIKVHSLCYYPVVKVCLHVMSPLPVPVKVTIKVYHCINGDRKFNGQNGPGTYFAYHHWRIVKYLTVTVTMRLCVSGP